DAAGWRLDLPGPGPGAAVPGLRVATWFDDPAVPIADDTRVVLDAAARALAEAGATVTPIDPPVDLAELAWSWERLVLPIMGAVLLGDAFAQVAAAVEGTPPADDEPRALRTLRAMTARHRDWLAADEARHRHRARFAEVFRDHDVVLAPVT